MARPCICIAAKQSNAWPSLGGNSQDAKIGLSAIRHVTFVMAADQSSVLHRVLGPVVLQAMGEISFERMPLNMILE